MKVLKQAQKLAELREKTDRQLRVIIDNHLTRGLGYVRQMTEAHCRGLVRNADGFRHLAWQEYAQAERFQQVLEAVGKDDARVLELRDALSSRTVRAACA
jgi:hypothetical protein